ncbi:sulfotransferase [Fuchsiella alkaliacetigena]|uniref:sulfotransferase n=1 Tax=Fuchsiella alkaliacetigena TaxID=957042 RepID=UPI00200A3DA0|nr:sulfotransferase [Fuchsiella alkaliacetigena]MCK8824323.1 sulfotransferase [Fuchsiella alkaliacetigena]
MTKKYNAIVVLGFGSTGSSAVVDLLREFETYKSFGTEFRLIKDPDGIMDLEDALVNNWIIKKDDTAIKRFKKLTDILGRETSKFSSFGKNYNKYCKGNFFNLTEKYINRLVDFSYEGSWIGNDYSMNWFDNILKKLKRKIGIKRDKIMFFSCLSKKKFYSLTKDYLNKIMKSCVDNSNVDNIILDQAVSPFSIKRALKYFYSCKIILVHRDPRDHYLEGRNRRFIPSDIEKFIKWYKNMKMKSQHDQFSSTKILNINFEDLVLNYKETFNIILNFLGEDKKIHIEKGKHFDYERACNGIKLWEKKINLKYKQQISKIYTNLSEYFFEF